MRCMRHWIGNVALITMVCSDPTNSNAPSRNSTSKSEAPWRPATGCHPRTPRAGVWPLRRLGRDAAVAGVDATDYQLSATARSFVPFYAQRISNNIVMHGAQGILNGLTKARNKQLRAAAGAA